MYPLGSNAANQISWTETTVNSFFLEGNTLVAADGVDQGLVAYQHDPNTPGLVYMDTYGNVYNNGYERLGCSIDSDNNLACIIGNDNVPLTFYTCSGNGVLYAGKNATPQGATCSPIILNLDVPSSPSP